MTSAPVVGPRDRRAISETLRRGNAVALPGVGGYLVATLALSQRSGAATGSGGAPSFGDHIAGLVESVVSGGAGTLLVATDRQASSVSAEWSVLTRRLTTRVWPGPVEVVVHASPVSCPPVAIEADGSVRLRVEGRRPLRRVVAEVGMLICSTLRGPTGQTVTQVAEAAATLGQAVALVVDGGPCTGAGPTVVDCRGDVPVVISEGRLPAEFVTAALAMSARERPSVLAIGSRLRRTKAG